MALRFVEAQGGGGDDQSITAQVDTAQILHCQIIRQSKACALAQSCHQFTWRTTAKSLQVPVHRLADHLNTLCIGRVEHCHRGLRLPPEVYQRPCFVQQPNAACSNLRILHISLPVLDGDAAGPMQIGGEYPVAQPPRVARLMRQRYSQYWDDLKSSASARQIYPVYVVGESVAVPFGRRFDHVWRQTYRDDVISLRDRRQAPVQRHAPGHQRTRFVQRFDCLGPMGHDCLEGKMAVIGYINRCPPDTEWHVGVCVESSLLVNGAPE